MQRRRSGNDEILPDEYRVDLEYRNDRRRARRLSLGKSRHRPRYRVY